MNVTEASRPINVIVSPSEAIKRRIARFCYVGNLLLGVVFPIITFPISIYMFALVLPLLGYVLIWRYFLESQKASRSSVVWWVVSLLFNAVAIWFILSNSWLFQPMVLWPITMALLSSWAAVLSLQIMFARLNGGGS